MPRDSSGNYTLPAGNPVVAGTLIEAPWANSTMDDIAVQLNNVLTRDGALGPTTQFALVSGTISRPGLGFSAETSLGLARLRAGTISMVSGGAEVFAVTGSGVTIPGDLVVQGDVTFPGGMVNQIIPGVGISVTPAGGTGAVTVANTYIPTLTGAWNWNDALSGDPGTGKIGANTIDLNAVTQVRMSKTDADGRLYSYAGTATGSTIIITPDGNSVSGSGKYIITGEPTVFATYADFPVSRQSGNGDIPDGTRAFVTMLPGQADSNGTVTGFYFNNANGVSGNVANPTTTPTLTLTLGDIVPTSVTASGVIRGSNIAAGATVSGSNTGDQTIPVTKIVAGTNITISPTSGLGNVTINATTSGGGGTVSQVAVSGQDGIGASVTNPNGPNVGIVLTLGDITPDSVNAAGNLAYGGTLTGGTGVINIGSNQFYKSAAGKFGFGQVASTSMFAVTGDTVGTTPGNNSIFAAYTASGVTVNQGIYRDAAGSTTTTLQYRIVRGSGGFVSMGNDYAVLGSGGVNTLVAYGTGQVDVQGNLVAGGNVTANSDERLKAAWGGFESDFIERMAGVKHGTYIRVDRDFGARHVGVGAQSLQKVLPEAVQADYEGLLSVNYGAAALVLGIELARRLLSLEQRTLQ